MTESDWMRLKGYSDKQNTYFDKRKNQWVTKVNELYVKDGGQIDTGFLMAKCIKHAFKTYPKINIGRGSSLESDIIEEQENFDPYAGVDSETAPQAQQERKQEETFALQPDMSAGVTIDPASTVDNDDTF